MKNRKIKFKAFHPTIGMMSTAELMQDSINPMADEAKVNNEKIIFLEYSGLDDRLGKEIYEEDIILTKFGRYVVQFTDGCFHACCIEEEDNVPLYVHNEDCEVVGSTFLK
jgi:hypothetical protein